MLMGEKQFYDPFGPLKCFPCEKLMSFANDLIPDSDLILAVQEQSTCCFYSFLVPPFNLTSARNGL